MPRPYLGDPKYTIEVLQKYNFAFQKRFGQNFLIDTHVLDKIIDSAQITKDDFVLEIGPGIGTMTQYLAEAAREVAAVEIDKTLQITDNEQAFSFTGSLYQKSYAFCKINIPISVFIIPSTFVQIFFTS